MANDETIPPTGLMKGRKPKSGSAVAETKWNNLSTPDVASKDGTKLSFGVVSKRRPETIVYIVVFDVRFNVPGYESRIRNRSPDFASHTLLCLTDRYRLKTVGLPDSRSLKPKLSKRLWVTNSTALTPGITSNYQRHARRRVG